MKSNQHLSIRLALLPLLLMLTFSSSGADTTAVAPAYDPIVATLDSLVRQCFVQRLSDAPASTLGFGEREVPVYSDEVYRQRIERIQSPIPLCFNDEVRRYIDLYSNYGHGSMERIIGLAQLYFPLYEQVLDQQGLPMEFKYLSVVESALNPTAVSPMGATGLWQFMLSAGKAYGLEVTSYTDDRRDPVKATYAACKYFKDMYAIYHDWLLVIASYNCGPGNVNRAIARSGGKRTFWEISPFLPKETRGYVPAFIAVTYVMNYTSEHNLKAVPPLVNFFEVDTVLVNRSLDLQTTAEAINVPYDVLSYLNPIYKKGIIPAGDEPQVLRLPSDRVAGYLAKESTLMQPSLQQPSQPVADISTPVVTTVTKYHRVRSGEHLQSIASKYRCSVSDLKRWNRLKSTKLRAGQSLKVYVTVTKKASSPASAQVARPASKPATAPAAAPAPTQVNTDTVAQSSAPSPLLTFPTGVIYHVVAPGDTLNSIARCYEGVTIEKIKEINQLESDELKVGTRLKLEVGS